MVVENELDDDRLDDDELAAWLRLIGTPGVGPATARRLLAAFGLPETVLATGRERLAQVVSSAVADALRAPPSQAVIASMARTRDWLAEPGNRVIVLGDPRYPAALLETADPPPLLYVKGRAALLHTSLLAVVGSRNPTAQGAIDARRFAEALARAGHTIVSGLALGIDAAAHEGALAAVAAVAEREGASTIAVIGTGADVVYPASHRALAHRIADAGAIVSELPLGTTASAHQFPRRNRLIAGLSRGVLVVEAAARSGSLITARLAAEANRDVFAIPGSIHSPLAKGCHQLIRQGAKLVETVDDVLDELGTPTKATARPRARDASDGDDPLAGVLGHEPVTVDALAARAGLDAARIAQVLLDLELAGRIARLPGGRVQRIVD